MKKNQTKTRRPSEASLDRKALRQSIAHWKRISTATAKPGEGITGDDCALCKRFHVSQTGTCRGCPVAAHRCANCTDTPYNTCYDAFDFDYDVNNQSPLFYKHAARMLKFLEKLLPKRAKR